MGDSFKSTEINWFISQGNSPCPFYWGFLVFFGWRWLCGYWVTALEGEDPCIRERPSPETRWPLGEDEGSHVSVSWAYGTIQSSCTRSEPICNSPWASKSFWYFETRSTETDNGSSIFTNDQFLGSETSDFYTCFVDLQRAMEGVDFQLRWKSCKVFLRYPPSQMIIIFVCR